MVEVYFEKTLCNKRRVTYHLWHFDELNLINLMSNQAAKESDIYMKELETKADLMCIGPKYDSYTTLFANTRTLSL